MKKTFFTTFVILFLQIITAQEQKMDCATVNVSQPVSNFQYLKSDNKFVINKYDKWAEVTPQTAADVMRSLLSASDLNWFNFNREKKVEKTSQDFGYIKSVNNNIYYIKLLNKINFVANGIEYAVIKFHLYDNDNIYGFAEAMKKINGKWVSTSDSQTTMLLFFMGMIKTSYIDAIMKKHNTDNQALNKIIQSSTKNEKIDFNAIIHNINNELPNNNKLKNIYDENRIFK